jgi:hypothetical protein
MLSDEIKTLRKFKFTASMAPAIMSDKPEYLLEAWQRAIGEIGEPETTWPMKLGSHCEPLILDHHQEKTGRPLTERGTFVAHPTIPDISATLDAYRADDDCVLDAKCSGSWMTIDKIVNFYAPQIVVQKSCRGAAKGALLIMHGTAEPREYPVNVNAAYEDELWRRIATFQQHVANMTRPVPLPEVVPPERWRTIHLIPSERDRWPNWAEDALEHLQNWNDHKDAADAFAAASSAVKKLLPDDVGTLTAPGVEVIRNRASALTIRRTR